MSAGSVVAPVHRTGRVCGASASSAPNVTMVSHAVSRATVMMSAHNPRHCKFGSGPVQRIRSGPFALSKIADSNRISGQWILRVTPSDNSTRGREAWKSIWASGSNDANRTAPYLPESQRSASDAASAPSFHPVNAATNTGFRRLGTESHCTEVT